jgi:lipopolysaccharide transport system ATP-binding protein
LWLEKGRMKVCGNAKEVINTYLSNLKPYSSTQSWRELDKAPGNEIVRLKRIDITSQSDKTTYITVRTPIQIQVEFWCMQQGFDLNVNFEVFTTTGECVFSIGSPSVRADKTVFTLSNTIPANLLNNATYIISLTMVKNHSIPLYSFSNCISFDVEDDREGISYFGKWPGIIRPQIESSLYKAEPV